MASIDETSLTDTAGLTRGVFAGSVADNITPEDPFTDDPNDDPPNIDSRRVMVVGTPTAGVNNEIIPGIASVPLATVSDTFTIDWDGSGTDNSGTFDVNNIVSAGCSGQNNDRTDTNDYNDWDNISFDFRGAAQSSFDGLMIIDPVDITPDEIAALEALLDHFEPNRPTDTGFQETNPSGTFKAKFTLSTCNPDNPETPLELDSSTCDIIGLKQNGTSAAGLEPFFFVDDVSIVTTMMKLNGAGADGTVFDAPTTEAYQQSLPATHVSNQLLFTADGKYEIDIDLDAVKEMFGEQESLGTYAIFHTVIASPISGASFTALLFDDLNQFITCSDRDTNGDGFPDQFDDCTAAIPSLKYTSRLSLVEEEAGVGSP